MHFTFDTWLAVSAVILGLVMGIPPLIQMLYGRPKLNVGTDEFTGSDGKQLLVKMKNKPIPRLVYRVDARIICGEQIYKLTKNMKIGSTAHETHWM